MSNHEPKYFWNNSFMAENNTVPYQQENLHQKGKNTSATSLVNIVSDCMDQPTPFTTVNY